MHTSATYVHSPAVSRGRQVPQQQPPAVCAQRRRTPAPRQLPQRVQVHLQALCRSY